MAIEVPVKRKHKIFPGWWTVLTGGILSLWGFGFQAYGFSAFLKPLAADLGLSRAVTSGVSSLSRLEGGLEAPLAGWLADKYGSRGICFIGVFIAGLGFSLMYFVHSMVSFYLVWGVIVAIGFNLGLSVPVDAAIAKWFVKKRGTALSIRNVLSGLSGVLTLPLVTWLLSQYGWRVTLVIGGIGMWLLLPLTWFLIKPHRPEYYGLLPDGAERDIGGTADITATINAGVKYAAEVNEVEFTLRQAFKTSALWIIIFANSMHGMVQPAVSLHGIPLLTDMGVSPMVASGAMSLMVFMSIPGRFIGGVVADRAPIGYLRYILAISYSVQCIGLLIFLKWQTLPTAYIFFILYGIGMGAGMAINAPLRGRYYGRKGFATIGGAMSLLNTPVGIIAPVYVGWTYDATGSYIKALLILTALLATAIIAICFAKPPKPPAEVGDITKFL